MHEPNDDLMAQIALLRQAIIDSKGILAWAAGKAFGLGDVYWVMRIDEQMDQNSAVLDIEDGRELFAEVARLNDALRATESDLILANSVLKIVEEATEGIEPDDFSQSFSVVRKVWDMRVELDQQEGGALHETDS